MLPDSQWPPTLWVLKHLEINNIMNSLQIGIAYFQELSDSMSLEHYHTILYKLERNDQQKKHSIFKWKRQHKIITYQPRGIMLSSLTMVHQIICQRRDMHHMGRRASTLLRMSSSTHHTFNIPHVILVYQTTAKDSGKNSTIHQKRQILALSNRNMSPNAVLRHDILAMLLEIDYSPELVLIIGDFNCSTTHLFLCYFITKHSLVDIMSTLHEQTTPQGIHAPL